LVGEFVQAIDAGELNGQLAKDTRVLQEALGILEGRATILGMAYSNFTLNVRDCGWELNTFVSGQLALDVVARILTAVPPWSRSSSGSVNAWEAVCTPPLSTGSTTSPPACGLS
jgi:hypothetical protein